MPIFSAYLIDYPSQATTLRGAVRDKNLRGKKISPRGNMISGKERVLPYHWLLLYRGEN